MPNVATLLNESVLVLMLKVVGSAVTTEVRPLLPAVAAVTVLAREILALERGGGDEAGDEEEAGTVTTVTTGVGGGAAAGEVADVISVVETKNDDPVD
jgi:hypothetical protein